MSETEIFYLCTLNYVIFHNNIYLSSFILQHIFRIPVYRILNCSFSFLVLVSLKPAIKLLSQHAVALVNSSPREQFLEIMVDACPHI